MRTQKWRLRVGLADFESMPFQAGGTASPEKNRGKAMVLLSIYILISLLLSLLLFIMIPNLYYNIKNY